MHERAACPLYLDNGAPVSRETDALIEAAFNGTLERAAKRKGAPGVPIEESLEAATQRVRPIDLCTPEHCQVFDWHLSNLEYSVNSDLKHVRNVGWDQDDAFGLEGAHCIVGSVRGMSCVVDELSQDLDVRFGARVTRIEYADSDGARVVFASLSGEESHIDAHAVVVTVPLGVLQSGDVEFSPPLPLAKRTAIANMGFGLLNKVVLCFPRKFWGDANAEMFGFCSARRGEMPIFVDLSHEGEPVLCVLVSGSHAETVESQDDAFVVAHAVAVLKRIFGEDAVPAPVESFVTRWRQDPFARGSFSFVKVGARPTDYDVLMAPVGVAGSAAPRVFFAGEHTNRFYPSMVHGALFSGVREARRIAELPLSGLASSDGLFVDGCKSADALSAVAFAEKYAPAHVDAVLPPLDARPLGRVFTSKLQQ